MDYREPVHSVTNSQIIPCVATTAFMMLKKKELTVNLERMYAPAPTPTPITVRKLTEGENKLIALIHHSHIFFFYLRYKIQSHWLSSASAGVQISVDVT